MSSLSSEEDRIALRSMSRSEKIAKGKNSSSKSTTLSKELGQQKLWKLRPQFSGLKIFDKLAANEFLPKKEQRLRENRALSEIVDFASQQAPYYKTLFKKLRVSAAKIKSAEDLAILPSLSKYTVQYQGVALQAQSLPVGQKPYGFTKSSGTTGKPTKILQTELSNFFFSLLKQRELRWFRLNIMKTLANIRLPSQLPRTSQNRQLEIENTLELKTWPYIGKFFHTGPFLGYSVFNSIDRQADWLYLRCPDYLVSYSESLEHLALTYKHRITPSTLKAFIAISEQLTPNMYKNINKIFGIPIYQNYGLNEIGIVASKCREGGLYHIHTEHCLAEIVDEEGNHCKAGETGKILVTTLTNYGMPLFRYDTDDLAMAVEGPCPCGRTLPTFGEVVGRYSRIAYLPENTLEYVGAIREALDQMPSELSKNLRQFQVHQFLDNRFELRLFAPGGLPQDFSKRINASWEKAVDENNLSLAIIEVNKIHRSPGGKFQDFTSDYFPAADK